MNELGLMLFPDNYLTSTWLTVFILIIKNLHYSVSCVSYPDQGTTMDHKNFIKLLWQVGLRRHA